MDYRPEDYDDHTAHPDSEYEEAEAGWEGEDWDTPWPTEAGEPITAEQEHALNEAWRGAAEAMRKARP